jgi:hypothetical protein
MTFDYNSSIKEVLATSIVEGKLKGTQPSDVEFRSLMQSIGLALYTNPTTIFYLEHLSRNYLLQQLAALSSRITDQIETLPNLVVKVDPVGTQSLEEIRKVLASIQRQGITSTESPLYKLLTELIYKYQTTELAKQVTGTADTLSSVQTIQDTFSTEIAKTLSDTATFIADLFKISVGRINFQRSSYRTILHRMLTSKSLATISDMVNQASVDAAQIAVTTSITSNILDILAVEPTLSKTPVTGLIVTTPAGVVTDTSSVFPVTLPTAATLTVTDNNGAETSQIPAQTVDLANKPHIIFSFANFAFGGKISFMLNVVTNKAPGTFAIQSNKLYSNADLNGLTLGLGDDWGKISTDSFARTFHVNVFSPTIVTSVDEMITRINDSIPATCLRAYRFPTASSDKIIIVLEPTFFTSVSCVDTYIQPIFIASPAPGYILVIPYTDDILDSIIFLNGRSSRPGGTPIETVVSSFNELFTKFTSSQFSGAGVTRLLTTGVLTDPASVMNFTGNSTTYLDLGNNTVVSNILLTNQSLIDKAAIGDRIEIGPQVTTISSISETGITIATPINSVDSVEAIVTPNLDIGSVGLSEAFTDCTVEVVDNTNKITAKLTTSMSKLGGDVTLAKVTDVGRNLTDLLNSLTVMSNLLTANPLSTLSAPTERSLANSIYKSFESKRMDRAVYFLKTLQLNEVFYLTEDTASFVGQVLQSASQVSVNDIDYPNLSKTVQKPIFTRDK